MVESVEGFLYPKVDRSLCVDCNLCNKVCPSLKKPSIGDFADCYAVQLINKLRYGTVPQAERFMELHKLCWSRMVRFLV